MTTPVAQETVHRLICVEGGKRRVYGDEFRTIVSGAFGESVLKLPDGVSSEDRPVLLFKLQIAIADMKTPRDLFVGIEISLCDFVDVCRCTDGSHVAILEWKSGLNQCHAGDGPGAEFDLNRAVVKVADADCLISTWQKTVKTWVTEREAKKRRDEVLRANGLDEDTIAKRRVEVLAGAGL
jgi:hypothetical protein